MSTNQPLFDDEELPAWLTGAGITHGSGGTSQPTSSSSTPSSASSEAFFAGSTGGDDLSWLNEDSSGAEEPQGGKRITSEMPWMTDVGDKGGSGTNAPRPAGGTSALPWMADIPGAGEPQGGKRITSEMPWMADNTDENKPSGGAPRPAGGTAALPWMADIPGVGEPQGGKRITSEMPWKADNTDENKPSGGAAMPWQTDSAGQSGGDDLGWLNAGTTGSAEVPAQADASDPFGDSSGGDSLDWLAGAGDEEDPFADIPSEPASTGDAYDWLDQPPDQPESGSGFTAATPAEEDSFAWLNAGSTEGAAPLESTGSAAQDEFALFDESSQTEDDLSWLNEASAESAAQPAAQDEFALFDESSAHPEGALPASDDFSWLGEASAESAATAEPLEPAGQDEFVLFDESSAQPEGALPASDDFSWLSEAPAESTTPAEPVAPTAQPAAQNEFSAFDELPVLPETPPAAKPTRSTDEFAWLNTESAQAWEEPPQPPPLDLLRPTGSVPLPVVPEPQDMPDLGGADDIPDWFKDAGSPAASRAPEPTASTGGADDIPDWFKDAGAPAATPAAAEVPAASLSDEDVPDWFKPSAEPAASAAQGADIELPDTGMLSHRPVPPPPPPRPTPSDDDLDWMAEMPDVQEILHAHKTMSSEMPQVPEPAAPEIAATPAAMDDDLSAALDWMGGEGEGTPPAPARSAAVVDEGPSWMSDMEQVGPTPMGDLSFDEEPAESATSIEPMMGSEAPDWLQTMPDMGLETDSFTAEAEATEGGFDIDALLDLSTEPGSPSLPGEVALPEGFLPPPETDLSADFELADFGTDFGSEMPAEPPAPSGPPLPPRITLESLGELPDFDQEFAPAAEPEPAAPPREPLPEFLADMQPAAGPVILRVGDQEVRLTDRPESILPDRFKDLLEQSRTVSAAAPKGESISAGALAGVSAVEIVPDLIQPRTVVGDAAPVIVSDLEARRIKVVQGILSVEEKLLRERQAAQEEDEEAEGKPAAKAATRSKVKIDRFIITLLLATLIALPFFINLNVVDLPDVAKLPESQKKMHTNVTGAVDQLKAGQLVLVAFEYGPTAAGELDDLAKVILRDVIKKGARPVILSSNPAGAIHAQDLMRVLGSSKADLTLMGRADKPLTARQEYIVLRYLPGGAVGVRALSEAMDTPSFELINVQAIFGSDVEGQVTGLTDADVVTLRQSPAFILVESPEDVRTWMEQYFTEQPQETLKMVLLSSNTASNVARAYALSADKRVIGTLSGFSDTIAYQNARQPQAPTAQQGADYTAQRWQSIAVGVLAAALIIMVGMLINVARNLRRVRR